MVRRQHTLKKNKTLKQSSYFKLILAILEDIDVFIIMSLFENDWKANMSKHG